MDIGEWLGSLDLERYEPAFRESEIDFRDVPNLTKEDLEELGIPLGPRRRLLKAIEALQSGNPVAQQVKPSTPPRPSPEPRDTAERRQLTVMFCDLMGSTALSSRMDPEDLREVISAYQAACAKVIQTYDGLVAKFMGDGILAYYGYPRAHEDDAERAVRAGLDIIRAIDKLKTRAPEALKVRIGIGTGLVVVGDLIGSGEAQERGVVGETPNLAARLQSLAAPNSIVIGPTTRRLLGDLFEYQDLGRIEVKGFDAPVQAYHVLRPSAVESRFEALRTTTTPLVGREEEIEILMRRWDRAKEGDGQVVLICGEPGIGKSRITQAVQDRLGTEPHTRLRYFCSPHHQDSALYPVITQLERAAGFRRDDTNEQRLAKLEAVLAQATNEREAVPLLADLLSIPTGDRYPLLNLTSQKRKEKTLKALLAQVEGLAAKQPVLMVFEDAHWMDPTTKELLDLIIDKVPALKTLMIVTFRPEFSPRWVDRSQVTLLTLNRLSPLQRSDMIKGVIGGKALPKEIADQIIERTDGIPLFIEELTKAVIDTGVVVETGDHYEVTGPLTALAIPTSLHGSLLARLDRLAPVREVVQIAAAIGRQFSHELISAISPMPSQDLDRALDQLVTAELIFRRGTPPDAEYTFKHALVQDAAYSTLLKSRRQHIHAQIAAKLEESFPEIVAGQPELLAHHCTEARLTMKAMFYRLHAGQQLLARSAALEAATQLEKGLVLLSGLPDDAQRRQRELEFQIALGRAFQATKGQSSASVGQTYARARQLCEELENPPQLVPVLIGQCVYHLVRSEFDLARQHAAALLDLGESRNDVRLLLLGHRFSAQPEFCLGEFGAARSHLEQGLSLFDPVDRDYYAALTLQDAEVMLLNWHSALFPLGYLDQARSSSAQALTQARRLEQAFTLAFTLHFVLLLNIHIGCRDGPTLLATIRHSDELMGIAAEKDFPIFAAFARTIRGWCLGALGKVNEGIELLNQGLANYRQLGAKILVPRMLTLLAEAYCDGQQPELALERLAEAEEMIGVTNERCFEAEVFRLRGQLFHSAGDCTSADACFCKALDVANRQHAKFFQLCTATSLARLWRDQGKRSQARDLLAPVYHWFTEGLDTPVLQEAKALLKELSA